MDAATSWDNIYARRREKLYLAENTRIKDIPDLHFNLTGIGAPLDERSVLISKFLTFHRKAFDPPADIMYSNLNLFLKSVPEDLRQRKVVFLDERCDSVGSTTSTRLWDSEGEKSSQCGYMNYPPKGTAIHTAALKLSELEGHLANPRKVADDIEKRVMYIHPPPWTGFSTYSLANRTIPVFRGFCHSHLLFKPAFKVHFALAHTFNLEFHIPFYALRKMSAIDDRSDPRILGEKPFRATRRLPLWRSGDEKYCYHEVHASFLVTGVDEWLWTAYCFVDTYFGNEVNWEKYVDEKQDPSTAGVLSLDFPVWNPRNYFLTTLEQRMTQATHEWTTLVNKFEERLTAYEENRPEFRDDIDLSHTEELTSAVTAIRRFRDGTSSTIDAWELFQQNQIQHLQTTGSDALRQRWDGYLNNIRGNISELKSLQSLLTRKLEHFNSIRDGFVNAAALRESATSRAQGENIGILTKMTVLYLPISLATSVFSMAMIPEDGKHIFTAYFIVGLFTFFVTIHAANFPGWLLNRILPDEGGRNVVMALVHGFLDFAGHMVSWIAEWIKNRRNP